MPPNMFTVIARGGDTSSGRALPVDDDERVALPFTGADGQRAFCEFTAGDARDMIKKCRVLLADERCLDIAKVEAALASTDIGAASLARAHGNHDAWGNFLADVLYAACARHAYWGEPISFMKAAELRRSGAPSRWLARTSGRRRRPRRAQGRRRPRR